MTGATQAALDLVENEQHVALARELPERLHELGIEHAHTAFTLNGLDDHGRDGFRIEHRTQFVEIPLDDRARPA